MSPLLLLPLPSDHHSLKRLYELYQEWSSKRLRLHFPSRQGKIGPVTIPPFPALSSQLSHPPQSQASFGILVNPQLIAPRVSSLPPPTATIHTLDFTAFTTDQPQKWLSPTPSSTTASQNHHQHHFDQDFQLFAAPENPLRTSPQASRAQAISSTLPNQPRLVQSRHLSITSGVSPHKSTPSQSFGHYYSSPVQQSITSPALQNQSTKEKYLRKIVHLQHLQNSTRVPPVPHFNQTTVPRRVQSTPGFPLGNMTDTFDSMYLPGGNFSTTPDDFLALDATFQSNNYSAVNSGANNGTISPSELLVEDNMIMSAPSSAFLPNFGTPDSSFLESPAMASSGLNTSPLEDGLLDSQLNFAELDNMAPLFPQNSFDQFAAVPQNTVANASFATVNSRPAAPTTGMERQKSSPGRPPSQPYHNRKRSETFGISKASKPRKPLPEITIDQEDDKEIAKRKKNTAAARKSRQRKQEHADAAVSEIQRLRAIIYRLGGDPDSEDS